MTVPDSFLFVSGGPWGNSRWLSSNCRADKCTKPSLRKDIVKVFEKLEAKLCSAQCGRTVRVPGAARGGSQQQEPLRAVPPDPAEVTG